MTIKQVDVVLGLGSNLGNRLNYLDLSISKLTEYKILFDLKKSSIYETKAILKENSPKEWDIDYLNMAVRGKTFLSPLMLLNSIKKIERELGRSNSQIWAPREIDIDILDYGNQIIKLNTLIIPHPQLLNRLFCINPLLEIYPDWKYPS